MLNRKEYEIAHQEFYDNRADIWCLDGEGETLSDCIDNATHFTGTYTPVAPVRRSVVCQSASDPVPSYLFCTPSSSSITTTDPAWSFTPGVLIGHPEQAEWQQRNQKVTGKRLHERPGQDPDTDIIAQRAAFHVDRDGIRAKPTHFNGEYTEPCKQCLQFRCLSSCNKRQKRWPNNLHKTVVSASGSYGYGLFAIAMIRKGTVLCEYVGEILEHDDVELRGHITVSLARIR